MSIKIRLNVKKIGKWGETLVVGLKKEFQDIGAKRGEQVAVEVEKTGDMRRIIIYKAKPK